MGEQEILYDALLTKHAWFNLTHELCGIDDDVFAVYGITMKEIETLLKTNGCVTVKIHENDCCR